jgi:hypothetical protein
MNAISKAIYSGTFLRDLEAAADRLRCVTTQFPANAVGFVLGHTTQTPRTRRCPNPNGYWLTAELSRNCAAKLLLMIGNAKPK